MVMVKDALRDVLEEFVEFAAANVFKMSECGFCIDLKILWKKFSGSLVISRRLTSSNFSSASSS